MSSKKPQVLCTCYKCKKKEKNGCYVSYCTRWRHIKKEKSNQYINDYEANKLALILFSC
jgi:hypothetical protein